MRLKNMVIIFSMLFIILCIGSASASEEVSNLTVADDSPALENENVDQIAQEVEKQESEILKDNATGTETNNTAPAQTTQKSPSNTKKTEAFILGNLDFIKKSNKYVKIKVATFDESKNKLVIHKNVKVTVKVKIGKTTKTYKVTTNSNGVAKVFNVKKLKVGTYKVRITSNDDRYTINDKGMLNIYKKKVKTLTLKINKRKKVKRDYIESYYLKRNAENPKGVYATSYNAKDPLDGNPHTLVLKAKFFFKNKKTGKIKTKIVKTKDDSYYLFKILPYTKLIKGYTPIKTKIWYVTI